MKTTKVIHLVIIGLLGFCILFIQNGCNDCKDYNAYKKCCEQCDENKKNIEKSVRSLFDGISTTSKLAETIKIKIDSFKNRDIVTPEEANDILYEIDQLVGKLDYGKKNLDKELSETKLFSMSTLKDLNGYIAALKITITQDSSIVKNARSKAKSQKNSFPPSKLFDPQYEKLLGLNIELRKRKDDAQAELDKIRKEYDIKNNEFTKKDSTFKEEKAVLIAKIDSLFKVDSISKIDISKKEEQLNDFNKLAKESHDEKVKYYLDAGTDFYKQAQKIADLPPFWFSNTKLKAIFLAEAAYSKAILELSNNSDINAKKKQNQINERLMKMKVEFRTYYNEMNERMKINKNKK